MSLKSRFTEAMKPLVVSLTSVYGAEFSSEIEVDKAVGEYYPEGGEVMVPKPQRAKKWRYKNYAKFEKDLLTIIGKIDRTDGERKLKLQNTFYSILREVPQGWVKNWTARSSQLTLPVSGQREVGSQRPVEKADSVQKLNKRAKGGDSRPKRLAR